MKAPAPIPVIYRTFPSGEVIALFPTLAATCWDPWQCTAYMHTGQHGSADPLLVHDTRPATPDEIAPLQAELERIGYALRPVKRFTMKHYQARKAELEPLKP